MFQQLLNTKGRARRSEWWLISIGVAVLAGLINIIVIVAAKGGDWRALSPDMQTDPVVIGITLGMTLLTFWPVTAVSIRRAHDRGIAGARVFIFQLIGLAWTICDSIAASIGFDFGSVPQVFWSLAVLALIYVIAAVYFLVTLGFMDGEPTTNVYGPSPKAGSRRNYSAPPADKDD